MAEILNLYLLLNTRTRDLTTETWNPKLFHPSQSSGLRLSGQSRHLPPGAATRHPKRGDDWIDDGGRRQ